MVDSVEQDDSEDEVFFGTVSDKEASRYKIEKRYSPMIHKYLHLYIKHL